MYDPETLVIDTWTSPVSISGTDLIKNLDEAVNSIVSTDVNSIKNHVNRELAKIPTYLSTEATKVYNETNLSAVSALDSKNSALASATTATDKATIATTKALEASISAGEALASKNSAVTSAGNALVSEQSADTSEANALIYKNSAETSATTATTQAGIATTKAGEASTSASNALTSRNEAEGFRDEAEASALSVDSANIVHKTGDETIAGVKTFSSSPIVPTPTLADNSTKVATTAFVIANAPVVANATETVAGKVELATTEEVKAGTDTTRAVTPAGMKAGLNATGTAPIYACRAWAKWNGTGTVAIFGSGNVSSITDNGTGDYSPNYITNMPDINYEVSPSCQSYLLAAPVSCFLHATTAPSVSSCRITTWNTGSGPIDMPLVCFSAHR